MVAYTRDAAGRLTGMSSVVASYFFTRDGNGRIVHTIETESLSPTPVASSTAYSYNDAKNRLLSAGAIAYGYDDEGQLTSAGATAYGYDYEHRLAAIGSDARFEYDGRGNRLRATRGGVVTRYIYDPWGNLLAEADGDGNITRTYIYGHGLLAMRTAGGDLYCYHFNATGSTVALTDAAGGIVNSYAYAPFGNVLGQQEGVSQPFKFVGQYGVMAEANDSLYYMRARYYDPRVGRFISEDPIGFAGGDVNLYGYVGNDPVNLIDPGGLQAEVAVGTGMGVSGWMGLSAAGAAGAAMVITLPLILYPSDIAEEPLIFTPPFPTATSGDRSTIKREFVDSDPDSADPDKGAEPWPSGDDNRGFCIQMYTLCKNQGWTGSCQACMDRCIGSGNGNWPFRGPDSCHPKRKDCK